MGGSKDVSARGVFFFFFLYRKRLVFICSLIYLFYRAGDSVVRDRIGFRRDSIRNGAGWRDGPRDGFRFVARGRRDSFPVTAAFPVARPRIHRSV